MPRRKRIDHALIQAALEGLEFQRQRLEEQVAQVRTLLRPRAEKHTVAQVPTKPKRTISAAGRKRIAAAQKKRWAALKKARQGK